ncbi:eIF2 kinase Gcn2p negative regulator [Ascosphaera pollenicola]|nr:eIF2 kinase Gcn2p negative regulator [Ascosphaera pollenicola]
MSLAGVANEELAEEIEAVNAIYEPDTITVNTNTSKDDSSTTVVLKIPEQGDVSFLIGFNADYPATPPKVMGTASTASRGEGKRWVHLLVETIKKVWQPGLVCLYDLIVEAGEVLEAERINNSANTPHSEPEHEQQHEADVDEDFEEGIKSLSLNRSEAAQNGSKYTLDKPPDWTFSDVLVEKKSVFVARAAHVTARETAEAYIDHLLDTDKKVAQATHNITAWRIRQTSTSADGTVSEKLFQDYDDDGETAAGGRLSHLMQLMDVWDVVVVVTRWYGGVKLGPDRFRIINEAARQALINGGWSKTRQEEGGEKGGKKKGKK